jgi:hypothetical protein
LAKVNAIEVLLPKQCGHCGGSLPHKLGKATAEGEPRRHQVTEVPPVKAHVTEYQFPNVVCEQCGKATRAALPDEIAGQFGPQLTALIAYWTVVCRLPRRLVEAMLADVLGIEISLGSTQKAWEEVSQAVAQPVAQLQEQLPREAVLNVDETGWRTNGDKRWLWGLVAQQFVFYVVASTRGAEVLVSLLGAVFRGILCNDRWVSYLSYHPGRMQLCWAHLKRNILGIADYARSPSSQQFCRDALAIVARLFRLWYRFRGDLRDRRGKIRSLLTGGNSWKSRSLCRRSCSLWRRHTWTMRIEKCATWLPHCSFTPNGYSHFWKSREWSQPTMLPNGPCARPCNGARSGLATAAAPAKSRLPACVMGHDLSPLHSHDILRCVRHIPL